MKDIETGVLREGEPREEASMLPSQSRAVTLPATVSSPSKRPATERSQSVPQGNISSKRRRVAIHIISASGLPSMDLSSLSDPYCCITIQGGGAGDTANPSGTDAPSEKGHRRNTSSFGSGRITLMSRSRAVKHDFGETSARENTNDPVWSEWRVCNEGYKSPEQEDVLCINVFDRNESFDLVAAPTTSFTQGLDVSGAGTLGCHSMQTKVVEAVLLLIVFFLHLVVNQTDDDWLLILTWVLVVLMIIHLFFGYQLLGRRDFFGRWEYTIDATLLTQFLALQLAFTLMNEGPARNAFRWLVVIIMGTLLAIFVFRVLPSSPDEIGHIHIRLLDVLDKGPQTIQLEGGAVTKLGLKSTLKFEVRTPTVLPLRKKVVFIRHGESLWNEAEQEVRVQGFAGVDHPLNVEGVAQALELNEKMEESEYKEDNSFISDLQALFVSPLTRAVQTALVAARGHPLLKKRNVLCRHLREKKNLIGLDTIGSATGYQICERVRMTLHESGDQIKRLDVAQVTDVNFDINDCTTEWWTKTVEDEKTVVNRISEFSQFLRHQNEMRVLLVGHSLWFRILLKNFGPEDHIGGKRKLSNAGCVGMTWEWDEEGELHVKDINLLFGSKFKTKDHGCGSPICGPGKRSVPGKEK